MDSEALSRQQLQSVQNFSVVRNGDTWWVCS